MRLEQLERFIRGVRALQQLPVVGCDRSPFHHRLEVEYLIPVVGAVQDDLDLLGELPRLHQCQDLEHLVQRSKAAREDDERLCEVREPELPHEEVVELEM